MLPVIALVGRPNVGKSTLFNLLTRSRDALVADFPGLTRDRQYGTGQRGERPYIVVDTGGLAGAGDHLDALMLKQVEQALLEADVILFMVDARDGLVADDYKITSQLRRYAKPIVLVVNKMDGLDEATLAADFYELGLAEPIAISSAHGRNVNLLLSEVFAQMPALVETDSADPAVVPGIRIAVIGRPNVGKSTLVNRMIGEERVVAFDQPGTTRDSIYVPFERDGQAFTLIDTAGVRRRARIKQAIEKFTVIKTLQAIQAAHVVILVTDGQESVSDQDVTLLGHALEAGRALVIAVNKWDGLTVEQREKIRSELDRKLQFVNFADIHFISALHGTNVGHLFESVQEAYRCSTQPLSTSHLTQILQQALEAHPPPLVRGRRIKLRYAHPGGQNPPRIVIHGNLTEHVPGSYQRYLTNTFRTALEMHGTPVRLEFRTGDNPYKGRKNKLTERQRKKRHRLMKHVKKGK